MRIARTALSIAAAAVLAPAAGCGSDSSGEDTSASVSIASPTSPLSTTAPTVTTPAKKGGGQSTTANGGSAACAVPDAFTRFSYEGISCTVAVSVATAWDQNGDDCNTIDDPNVAEGFKKTCTVNGYSCLAKRDVRSDGRFVTCSTGAATVRFKWFPA